MWHSEVAAFICGFAAPSIVNYKITHYLVYIFLIHRNKKGFSEFKNIFFAETAKKMAAFLLLKQECRHIL